jgi:hypothetical protein
MDTIKSFAFHVLKAIALVTVCSVLTSLCPESSAQGPKVSYRSKSQIERGDERFTIKAVDFGEIGWGKNKVRIKAKNLTNEMQQLLVRINASYLDSGRFYPIEDGLEFDFEPLQEKEISRDFYVIPDHGTLEIRCFVASRSKTGLYETVFFNKYRSKFDAPNHRIHMLGFGKAEYPAFEIGKSEHFVFYYFPQNNQAGAISNVIQRWEKSFNDLRGEVNGKSPGRILLFLLPDVSSANRIMQFEGRRLLYHNTIILITDKGYDPKPDLEAFFLEFPLLANRMDDFYLGTGGYGYDGISGHEIRFKVLLCLYQGLSPKAIAERLDFPESEITKAADELVNISNARKQEGIYKPDILILTRAEARRIQAKADQSARNLAGLIERDREKVEAAYRQLSFSDIFSFKEIGFHLIGSLVLEEGMIDFFFRDRTLLPPYPHRPIKDDPEGAKLRYYCWMIEGREIEEEFYGFNDPGYLDKPQIVNYGRYFINLPRSYFNRTVEKLIEVTGGKEKFVKDFFPEYQKKLRNRRYRSSVPEIDRALKEFSYRLPVYTEKDISVVQSLISELGPKILDYFKNIRSDLEQTFKEFEGSQFSSFREFFYTYYHLVFARATNNLAERGFFFLPKYRFESWMQEKPILDVMNLQ